jgi:hypothetical protein
MPRIADGLPGDVASAAALAELDGGERLESGFKSRARQ